MPETVPDTDRPGGQSYARAREARARGDFQAAIEFCRERIGATPDDAAAHGLLGQCLCDVGEPRAAMEALQQAIRLDPGCASHYTRLGEVYRRAGHNPQALKCYEKAHQLDPDDIETLNGYGTALLEINRLDQARTLLERALALDPTHPFVRRSLHLLARRMLPRWHFPMINDRRRNELFEQAIRRAVTPESIVLDIGAGTGLLSLMAARAGARRVIACEINPQLAELAREVVKRNGFADRISVLNKFSQQLRPGVDFPERPDVLIAEVFDSAVIGEGALDTFDHARRELLAPGARIIPQRAEVRAALVESEALWAEGAAAQASGFDLSPLNRYRPDTLGLAEGRFPLTRLSEDFVLLPFDFSGAGPPCPLKRRLKVPVSRDGTCHAVVYWMKAYLDEETALDNRPDLGDGAPEGYCEHWGPLAKLIPSLELKRGMELPIEAHHNRRFVAMVLFNPETGEVHC